MEKTITSSNTLGNCEPTIVDTTSLSYFFQRLKFKIENLFFRYDPKLSSLYQHALMELRYAGYFKPEDDEVGKGMNKLMADNVLELIEVFAKQGHSGFSASFAVGLFESLAKYEPLSPLTGEDREWADVSNPSGYALWQNKRCSHVFKEANGNAYDVDGKIFKEPNGACYTNKESRTYVTFPYTPKREYVDVPSSE